MLRDYLGEAIRTVRLDRNISQEELAFRFGEAINNHSLRKNFINKIEIGKQDLSLKKLAELCKVMKCLTSDLLGLAERLEIAAKNQKPTQ